MTNDEHGRRTTQEDPEVTVAKWTAYRREQRRHHKLSHMVSWILALPAGYLAWEYQIHYVLLGWLYADPETPQRAITMFQYLIPITVWSTVGILLFPLRMYLKARWSVEPEQYGIGDGGSND